MRDRLEDAATVTFQLEPALEGSSRSRREKILEYPHKKVNRLFARQPGSSPSSPLLRRVDLHHESSSGDEGNNGWQNSPSQTRRQLSGSSSNLTPTGRRRATTTSTTAAAKSEQQAEKVREDLLQAQRKFTEKEIERKKRIWKSEQQLINKSLKLQQQQQNHDVLPRTKSLDDARLPSIKRKQKKKKRGSSEDAFSSVPSTFEECELEAKKMEGIP